MSHEKYGSGMPKNQRDTRLIRELLFRLGHPPATEGLVIRSREGAAIYFAANASQAHAFWYRRYRRAAHAVYRVAFSFATIAGEWNPRHL